MQAQSEIKIRLPYPHPGQQMVRRQARRFNWLAAGRRWRKTTLFMAIAVEAAVDRQRIVWGAPVYDQVWTGWEETVKALWPLIDAGYVSKNQSRMEIAFPGGGQVVYRSLDDPDNVRGKTADGVIIDEAGEVAEAAWHEVMRPMLLDTGGWAWIGGTPKGRNWFWRGHVEAADDRPDAAAWQAPTLGAIIRERQLVREPHPLENPHIGWVEMTSLYNTMPEDSFRQEILAEFIEDAGLVFRGVASQATAARQERAIPGHIYVIGCDWAKTGDFTAFTVIDCTTAEEVCLDRFNQLEYLHQIGRLKALCERFGPVAVRSEKNSNEALHELLWRTTYTRTREDGSTREEPIPLEEFVTTNANKSEIIQSLALAFERAQVRLLDDRTHIAELQAFGQERLPSGMIRYQAPEGLHDDTVMSLALAWSLAKRYLPDKRPTPIERAEAALAPELSLERIEGEPDEDRRARLLTSRNLWMEAFLREAPTLNHYLIDADERIDRGAGFKE